MFWGGIFILIVVLGEFIFFEAIIGVKKKSLRTIALNQFLDMTTLFISGVFVAAPSPPHPQKGSPWSRVDERCLWTGGHLGSTTPAVLLRSLVYLNAKRMRLRSTQQHLDLSFANVYGPDAMHPVTTGKSRTCVRVPSPVSQGE